VAKHYGEVYEGGSKERRDRMSLNKKGVYENEILQSNAKGIYMNLILLVDERIISARLNSEYRQTHMPFNSEYRQIPMTIEKRNQFESVYRPNVYFSDLPEEGVKENLTTKTLNVLAMKYPKKLQKLVDNSEQAERDLRSLNIRDIERTIEMFKNNFYNQSITNLLDEHFTNVDSLNKLLIGPFGILVMNEMTESNQELIQSFSNVITSNTINFNKAVGLNMFDTAKYKLFFGDDSNLSLLQKVVEEKLKDIKDNKRVTETKESILTSEKVGVSANPFLSKEKKFNIMSYYNESMNKHTQDQLENLDSLVELLRSRLRLNAILLPTVGIKYMSQQHKQVTL
jgi:hypothetical protein